MTFRVSLPTCSIAARPVRGPAPSPARPSVRRAATLVAEKLHTAVECPPAAEVLSDTDFLAELRAHATRHGLSSPLLSLDEDACEQLPAGGAPDRHQAGAASLQASSLRTQRRARPRLRRRAQRARAAWGAPAATAATESERDAVAGGHALISRDEELELCSAITVCYPFVGMPTVFPIAKADWLALSWLRIHVPQACVSVQLGLCDKTCLPRLLGVLLLLSSAYIACLTAMLSRSVAWSWTACGHIWRAARQAGRPCGRRGCRLGLARQAKSPSRRCTPPWRQQSMLRALSLPRTRAS